MIDGNATQIHQVLINLCTNAAHAMRSTGGQLSVELAAAVLQDREGQLSQATEDVARLAARHQSAQRLLDDSRKTLARSESEEEKAREAVHGARANS